MVGLYIFFFVFRVCKTLRLPRVAFQCTTMWNMFSREGGHRGSAGGRPSIRILHIKSRHHSKIGYGSFSYFLPQLSTTRLYVVKYTRLGLPWDAALSILHL